MIAEDSGLIRALVAELLTGSGFQVTGQAATGAQIVALALADPPDVVVLDIRMPPDHREEGLEAAESIRAALPAVGLLVLSHYGEPRYATRLLERVGGAVGYLVKDRVADADRLLDAVVRVGEGEVVVDSEVIRTVMSARRRGSPLDRLTPTEHRVLTLMAQGCSNASIARQLQASSASVERYATTVFAKLELAEPAQPAPGQVNRRVLAVLAYLREVGEPAD